MLSRNKIMNQILGFIDTSNNNLYKKNKKSLTILLITSILFLIFFLALIFFRIYFLNFKDENAKTLAESFSISRMYSSNQNYTANFENTVGPSSPFVIGIIKIDSLKIDYPILSDVSDELLEIAPCRFAGPLPNEVGNLCIAGHNYIDNTFFARISSMSIDDEILIYDLSGNCVKYIVSDKYEVESSDFSCTSQDTGGKRIITLMTCNSLKGTRIIVRGREI